MLLKRLFLILMLVVLVPHASATLTVWLESCDDLPMVTAEYEASATLTYRTSCITPVIEMAFDTESEQESTYQRLLSNPQVRHIDRDLFAESTMLVSDPNFDEQWHFKAPRGVDLELIWSVTGGDCSEPVIIVMDSGVHYQQTGLPYQNLDFRGDLDGRLELNPPGVSEQNYGLNLHCPNEGECFQDDIHFQYHGTHVTGIIAANWNDRFTAGLCRNARIVPINFLGKNSAGFNQIEDSWLYIERLMESLPESTPVIWNNSWVIGSVFNSEVKDRLLTKYSDRLLVVSAAGNSGQDIDGQSAFPAGLSRRFNNAMTIGNHNYSKRLHSSSNYGDVTVDLALPGTDILSLSKLDPTSPESGLASLTGTSMAAPMASALAALLWTQEPHLTAVQVRAKLLAAAGTGSHYIGPMRYPLALDENELFLGAESPSAIFNYTYTGAVVRVQGSGLGSGQVLRGTLNGAELELLSQADNQVEWSIPGSVYSGYLYLEDGAGQKLAQVWIEKSIDPPRYPRLKESAGNYRLEWEPSLNASDVRIERLDTDGSWREWDTVSNSLSGYDLTGMASGYFAYRLVAIQSSAANRNGNAEEMTSVPSRWLYDEALFDMVHWSTLEIASIPADGDNITLESLAPGATVYELTDAPPQTVTTDRGLSIPPLTEQVRLGVIASSSLPDVQAVRRWFDLSPQSGEGRTFTHPDYQQLIWPGAVRSLQLRKPLYEDSTFVYGEWLVGSDGITLLEMRLTGDFEFYRVYAWSSFKEAWVEWDTQRPLMFVKALKPGSEWDLDPEDEVAVTLRIKVQYQRMSAEPAEVAADSDRLGARPCFVSHLVGRNSAEADHYRAFRDSVLERSAVGRQIIVFYYDYSDAWVALVDQKTELKAFLIKLLELAAYLLGALKA